MDTVHSAINQDTMMMWTQYIQPSSKTQGLYGHSTFSHQPRHNDDMDTVHSAIIQDTMMKTNRVIVERNITNRVIVERNKTNRVIVERNKTNRVIVERNKTNRVIVERNKTNRVIVERNKTNRVIVQHDARCHVLPTLFLQHTAKHNTVVKCSIGIDEGHTKNLNAIMRK
ncbi:hypothetical protein Btru_036538 [Bulinus truncatus]|nr:hypothetical protein Btru_036538 [Bulinus truncatus]